MDGDLSALRGSQLTLVPTPTRNSSLPFRRGGFASLCEALDYAARGETGLNFFEARGRLLSSLPYRDLQTQARTFARRLIGAGIARGERLLIVADTWPGFCVAFFGAQYAGVLPVPVSVPVGLGAKSSYIEQLSRQIAASGAIGVVAPDELAAYAVTAAQGTTARLAGSMAIFEALPEPAVELRPLLATEQCYVQFSSGSTRAPMGIDIRQDRLMANIDGSITRQELNEDDAGVSWLPLYHDMGLIGFILAPMCAQRSVDLLAPRDFARRPTQWLSLISRRRATITYSPSFGYDLVARRFIAVFFPPAKFEVTKRITTIEGEKFKTDGKVLREPGWLEVYGKTAAGDDDDSLVPVQDGESAAAESIEVKELETKPPARYTEGTLLSAMEGAGKLVEDEELREAMSQRGLGTPATRASVIEGLLTQEYIRREGRDLAASAKGLKLITALREIKIEALSSPELTGEWEHKLKEMEAGRFKRDAFMEEIRTLVAGVIQKIKDASGHVSSETMRGNFHDLTTKCPRCGSTAGFKESFKAYDCQNPECKLVVWKTVSSRELEPTEVTTLLETGSVGPIKGFKSKMGRPFEAKLALSEGTEWKTTFDFGDGGIRSNEPFNKEAATLIVEKCPVCEKGGIYEAGIAYACEQGLGPEKKCAFRMGKMILQREISPDDVRKICTEGKTNLLTKFISKKGRPFNAFLVLDKKSGKVGFEFEERKPKAPKKGAAKAATA